MHPQRPSEFLVGWEKKWNEISEFQPSFQGLGVRCPSSFPQASIEQNCSQGSKSRGSVLGRGSLKVFGVGKFSEEGRRGLGGKEQHRKKLTRSLAARSALGQLLGAGE